MKCFTGCVRLCDQMLHYSLNTDTPCQPGAKGHQSGAQRNDQSGKDLAKSADHVCTSGDSPSVPITESLGWLLFVHQCSKFIRKTVIPLHQQVFQFLFLCSTFVIGESRE